MTSPVHLPRQLPLIVRIAGLSADELSAFEDSRVAPCLEELRTLEAALEAARQGLVEPLYEAVQGAEKAHRRGLLGVKRDCFNGRPLGRWKARPEWPVIEAAVGPQVREIVDLEAQRDASLDALRKAFGKQLQREEEGLLRLTQDRSFVRGMGLSSLILGQTLERVAAGGKLKGKRRRRMFISLLRYATRAALKLSPFSTLTPVGLGRLTEADGGAAEPLVLETDWQSQSGVWIYRYFLDQLVDLFGSHPACRAGLGLRINDTLETLPDGRLRFLRPRRWEAGQGEREGRLVRRQPALVKARLTSPVIEHLRTDLARTTRPHSEVVERLLEVFPERSLDEATSFVNRLVDIGVLLLVPPWPTGEVDVQGRLLDYLQSLPSDPAMQPVVQNLGEFVPMLREFATSEQPTRSIARGKELAESLAAQALEVSDLDPSVAFFAEEHDHYFTEDVFVAPAEGDRHAVLTLPADEVERLAHSVAPLARLAGVQNMNADYLISLADAGREQWPNETRVPFLDFFEATQPVYQEYIRFQMGHRRLDSPRLFSFNPRSLDGITQFDASRREVAAGLKHCLEETDQGWELVHSKVSALLDTLPPALAACRDFNAFLQPYEDNGRRWVLNDLFEGAGRMSSRFTTAMPESVRQHWSDSLTAHSSVGLWGRSVEIIDLLCPEGHTLNVHAPQTRRTLVLPGESVDLEPERQLRLRDLWIQLDQPPFPVLADARGQALAPLHLGGVVVRYMPSLFKFLTFFGTTELGYRIPTAKSYESHDDLRVMDRHTLGDVVYRRKAWTVDRAKAFPKFEALRGVDLMLAVDDWRHERGIPDQIFMQEPVEGGLKNPHRKPQFIDFTSPSLVELFRMILQNDFPTFLLAEALPATHQHPRASDGRRRAFEIQVDTFGEARPEKTAFEYRMPDRPVVGTGSEPARASRLELVPSVR